MLKKNDLPWHMQTATEAEAELKSSRSTGLTSAEAEKRFQIIGPNSFAEEKAASPLRIFLSQFNDFMIWVLLAALLISSVILRELTDALAIGAILILNASLGFRQEFQAEKALTALKIMTAPEATALRDGEELILPAAELVPGDVIFLHAGDTVPADCRLLEAAACQVGESALTGESQPVTKNAAPLKDEKLPLGEKRNMVFAGTNIVKGRAKALVVTTGGLTEMGKIAALLQGPEEQTPLQVELKKIGKIIAAAALSISVIVFAFGFLIRGYPAAELFLVAVSLAVAAIPEGLPAIVTLALALGVQDMAKKHAIIRKLHAVETLGSVTYICTDKTGTLTENRMTLAKIYTAAGEHDFQTNVGPPDDLAAELLKTSLLCNDARFGKDGALLGDPTEAALLRAAESAGFDHRELRRRYPRAGEIPFDSDRKRMTTINKLDGGLTALVKGAPEEILTLSRLIAGGGGEERLLTEAESKEFRRLTVALAASGYRILAFAKRHFSEDRADFEMKTIETDLTFIGLGALYDPPRTAVPAAVADCGRAGIRVVMVTGDHLLTAEAIAKKVGIADKEQLTGGELEDLSEAELAQSAETVSIYARVAPTDKVKIVGALKSLGHTVAMTGDGINDAPALRRADIGIAMGKIGTDVAREAADIVLADDNFATIVAAVKSGRHIFDNLKKTILFLLSCNISEVLVLLLAIIIPGLPLPLLPIQILWINLVTDGSPALALGVDPPAAGLMRRPPRPRSKGVLSGSSARLLWQGLAITAGVLFVFVWALFEFKVRVAEAQTMVFTTMVLGQLLHSLNFRSETISVFSRETLKNRLLLVAVAGSVALQLIIIYLPGVQTVFHTTPLELKDLTLVVIGAVFPMAVADAVKLARRLPKNSRR